MQSTPRLDLLVSELSGTNLGCKVQWDKMVNWHLKYSTKKRDTVFSFNIIHTIPKHYWRPVQIWLWLKKKDVKSSTIY